MKHPICFILSLVLAVSLVPASAFAEMNLAPATSSQLASQSESSSASGVSDVSHLLSETTATVQRTVPEAQDFRTSFGVTNGYPVYNENFDTALSNAGANLTTQKAAVLAEDNALLDYTGLTANGTYVGSTQTTVTRLVRHTTGVANYGETIPDTAPSTTKHLSIRMVRYGNVVTGLYAAPGEIVKITLNSSSSDTPVQNLGLKALIGNYGGNQEHVEIPDNREYVRMPKMDKSLDLNAADGVNYVGSPFGGAILIYSNGIGGTTVDMTIEGAVEMPTYFYGETSDAELARQLQAPGPYFAFSTPRGLRAVGPASLVRGRSVAQVKKAMEFWDKAIGVSYQMESGSFDSSNPDTNLMVEMFEPYIPAGAAVNMGNYCICPVGWGSSFLDGDGLITDGAWGQIHELNHSFPWGGAVDGATEITNNVISALTYQLYTNIAAKRTEPTNRNDPSSGGLTGWNWCTDLYTTMERIRLNVGPDYQYPQYNLQVYVPTQQAFGADRFIESVHRYHALGGKYNRKLSGNALYTNSNVWMRAVSEVCGYNMGYLMRDVLDFPEYATENPSETDYITTDVRSALTSTGQLYIPSGCLYASGFAYDASGSTSASAASATSSASSTAAGAVALVSGRGTTGTAAFESAHEVVEMGRPFRVPYGSPKTLDFHASTADGYVSVARGETVELVGYTMPTYGTLTSQSSDGLALKYTPSTTANALDDSFFITLKLTVTKQDSPYRGQSGYVTYKISLLQETGGFTTSFYEWTNPSSVSAQDAVTYAISQGVLEQNPLAITSSTVAGYDSAVANTFAVTEGKVFIPKTGAVDLYVRGNNWFNTCVAASASSIPSADRAQAKRTWQTYQYASTYDMTTTTTRIQVYVVPTGGSVPSDASAYAAVINQGDPLYVRNYMVVGSSGVFRIGYRDGDTAREFAADQVWKMQAPTANPTPSVASFTRDKIYTYQDPAVQDTDITGDFVEVGGGLTVRRVWDLTKNTELAARQYAETKGADPASMVDPLDTVDPAWGYRTQFHSYISSSPYEAEFVFELDSAATFNTLRLKGHNNSSMNEAGKIKDYEVYVGNDYDALLAASATSALCVAKGTLGVSYNYGEFDRIELATPATGTYVRLVARSSYPRNGQYYYTVTDFRVGQLESISGEGLIDEEYTTTGSWEVDDAFINTRTDLMATKSGTGTFEFTGTGVIMYSATGPEYGKMVVSLDGIESVIDLSDTKLRGQQPVFWKSGLSDSDKHVLTFSPQTAGTDTINVEYFEVKNGQASDTEPVATNHTLQLVLDGTRFSYTGSAIKPGATVYLDGTDVTSSSQVTVSYADNVNVGTAVVTAVWQNGSDRATATDTFDILKITYPGAGSAAVSFTGNATGYQYGQTASMPSPRISGAPTGATVVYYYSDAQPGDLSSMLSGNGITSGALPGTIWNSATMTTSSLDPGTYYLWAIVSSHNYSDFATEPFSFTVTPYEHVHSWNTPTYTWSSDYTQVTAHTTCRSDSTHVLSRTVDTDYAVTLQPTSTSQGEGTYTATFSSPFETQAKTVPIPALAKQPLTVTLDTHGGILVSERAPVVEVYQGSPYGDLPDATRTGWVFAGWFTSETGGTQVTSSTRVSATTAHTLHAHWDPTSIVEGELKERTIKGTVQQDSALVAGATVRLMRGTTVFGEAQTDESGSYSFDPVPYGTYNVVVDVVVGGQHKTVTTMVAADAARVEVDDLYLPAEMTSSQLVVDDGTRDVVVGGLDDLAQQVRESAEAPVSAGGAGQTVESVSVVMTVAEKDEWEALGSTSIRSLAEGAGSSSSSAGIGIDYLDVSLEQTVVAGSKVTTALTSVSDPLTVVIPFDFADRQQVAVYRYHAGTAQKLTALTARPSVAMEGRYYSDVSAGLIYVYASEFSTYAIGYSLPVQAEHVHAWGAWQTVIAPGCTTAGTERRVCELDASHVETREVEALGHEWGEWEQTVTPTPFKAGKQVRVCLRDTSHVEEQEIPALGLDYLIEKPQANDFVYDGKQHVGVAAGKGYTLSGTPIATGIGTYLVIAELNPGYQWRDGTTSEISLVWKIEKAIVSVKKPTATNYIYDATEHVGVAAGEGYELSGRAKAIRIGVYRVTATLVDGYVWDDGTYDPIALTWIIGEASPTPSDPGNPADPSGPDPKPQPDPKPGSLADVSYVYRLYNPSRGEHLYTCDSHEIQVLNDSGRWYLEGAQYSVPGKTSKISKAEVHRLFNPVTGEHLYSSDMNECSVLTDRYGWSDEGVVFWVPTDEDYCKTAVYRLNNPQKASFSHLFTTDLNECASLLRKNVGWEIEGTAWYGL